MSKNIIDIIHEAAKETFDDFKNLDMVKWYGHWIEVANEIATELENDGLIQTAEYIRSHVKLVQNDYDRIKDDQDKKISFEHSRVNGIYNGFDSDLFLKMVVCEFSYNEMSVNFKTNIFDWCEWWKSLTKQERTDIAKQVEMTFGREAYQK